jgi:hypothetical protein
MIALMLGLIDPISRIAGKIADYKIAAQNATTDRARIEAEERASALEAKRDVMVAESGSRINLFIRAGFALPFVIYNAKLVIWDKVLALGSTDPLSPELYNVQLATIGFYFLHSIVARVVRR